MGMQYTICQWATNRFRPSELTKHHPECSLIQPSKNSALQMSLPSDTFQGIADALGYLQHHLYELTERQNISENNINTTLVALTTQLQQLTQLVANLLSPFISNTPPPSILSSLVSPPVRKPNSKPE